MSFKLLGAVGILAMALVGCGDDAGTGGAGGEGGTGGGTGGTGGGTGGTGGTGGGAVDCSEEATNAECRDCCAETHPEGYAVLRGAVVAACGCAAAGDCYAECDDGADPVCTGGTVGEACSTCLQSMGSANACSAGAAFAPACQDDAACKATVDCILDC